MSSLPPLLKAQFDDGLRVRRPKPTQDFYKHIYVNSNERRNGSYLSTDCEFVLQTPIETPPDGTTTLRLHRASIPYTFNNIVQAAFFVLDIWDGAASTQECNVMLPPGYYTATTITSTMNDCIKNVNLFTAGPNVGKTTTWTVSTVNNYFVIRYDGSAGNLTGKAIRIRFPKFTDVDMAFFSKYTRLNTSYDLASLTKRTIGYDNLVENFKVGAVAAASVVSDDVFGPFQEFEIFLRVGGFPVGYDMIDVKDGAPSDILAVIPLNVDTFGSVITLDRSDSMLYVIPPNARIQKLYLKLTYRDSQNLVDLNGQDFSAVISIIKESSQGAE